MRNEDQIRKEFGEHKPEHVILSENNGLEVEKLVWGRNRSSYYKVLYLREFATLCVWGDLGEAIYRWSSVCDLRWISTCDLSYFSGKCLASENGRQYHEWSSREAERGIDQLFKDLTEEDRESAEEVIEKFNYFGGSGSLHFEQEWNYWLASHGYNVFGEDYSEHWDIGSIISYRCECHLLGLKMAFEVLDGPKVS